MEFSVEINAIKLFTIYCLLRLATDKGPYKVKFVFVCVCACTKFFPP